MTIIPRLRIAIQKSGRLNEESQRLLQQSGIKFSANSSKLLSHADNMPIDILFVRGNDVPGLIMEGVVDFGILGENTLEETRLNRQAAELCSSYRMVMPLGFGQCRLSIATPEAFNYNTAEDLEGLRIATSYPQLLKFFMQKKGVSYEHCLLNGSVEVAPRAGLADAVCDLVSTGATLEANGLREVETFFRSQAVLIQKNSPNPSIETLSERLLLRINGVIQARESKYIMLHAPRQQLDEVIALLPCAEKPTILPLAHDEMTVAIHVVSKENLFWETMEALKEKGCSSILVLPVEKIME